MSKHIPIQKRKHPPSFKFEPDGSLIFIDKGFLTTDDFVLDQPETIYILHKHIKKPEQ